MKGKGVISAVALILFSFAVNGQQLSHQVLVPGAGLIVSGGISYSQTIGETAVEIIGDFEHVLTQGFQQPRLKVTVGEAPHGNGVKVYPNPATDYVNVEFFGETSRAYSVTIININGQKIFADELDFNGSHWYVREIPLRNLARGFYFIRIVSKDELINRSFKIEKM
ncbi:MAG TPA: T9SS type A sorting domain-containing protein [Bacteroidales bacterium]|nr:T9SS type A sorting domain-containing protein [Bacteroidales bacterium]HQG55902.1 T9SS type A sorting domain-containing protein [Bacteroidales bacterium]